MRVWMGASRGVRSTSAGEAMLNAFGVNELSIV